MRGLNSSFSNKHQPGSAPVALVSIYAARRQRTIDLVTGSIGALRADRLVVSLASIAARSRILDQTGRGVSETAILRNQDARALYQSPSNRRRTRSSPPTRAGAWIGTGACDGRDPRPGTDTSAI
jgi:hypothetical protein